VTDDGDEADPMLDAAESKQPEAPAEESILIEEFVAEMESTIMYRPAFKPKPHKSSLTKRLFGMLAISCW
jgi:hypothetical protein